MRKSSSLPLVIGIVFVLSVVGGISAFIFWPKFTVTVEFSDLEKIQEGDKLYMNGMAIGEIRKVELVSADKGAVEVRIDKEHKNLINAATVFSIGADRLITGRKCLLCKNCAAGSSPVESEHVFQGVGWIRYKMACIEQESERLWQEHLREIVIQGIEKGDELSEEAMERLEKFKEEHEDDFAAIYEQFKRDWEKLTPEIQKQLDEIMGSGGGKSE